MPRECALLLLVLGVAAHERGVTILLVSLDLLPVPLNFLRVFLVITVEYAHYSLLRVKALHVRIPRYQRCHAIFSIKVHRLVRLTGVRIRHTLAIIEQHVVLIEADPISEHAVRQVLVEVQVDALHWLLSDRIVIIISTVVCESSSVILSLFVAQILIKDSWALLSIVG